MKKILFCIIFLTFAVSSFAAKAIWTPSEGATGYYLYVRQGETEKFWKIEGGSTSEFTFNIAPGAYEFDISAFNDAGESQRSAAVQYTIDAYTPKEPDEPETLEPPQTPSGFELIKEGFALIFKGIKDLI